jgi:hypothetical protein
MESNLSKVIEWSQNLHKCMSDSFNSLSLSLSLSLCVCVCVCVCGERERDLFDLFIIIYYILKSKSF